MDAQRQHHETMERLLVGRNLINRQRRRITQELPCRSQILPERHLPAPMFTTLPQPNRLCRLTHLLLVLKQPRAEHSHQSFITIHGPLKTRQTLTHFLPLHLSVSDLSVRAKR